MEEKHWIIKNKDENPQISQPKITSRFDRPITRQCVSRILQKKTKILTSILASIDADPELQLKMIKHFKTVSTAKFDAELLQLIVQKYNLLNLLQEIIRLCCQDLQKRPEYAEDSEIQSLKFSDFFYYDLHEESPFKAHFRNKKIISK